MLCTAAAALLKLNMLKEGLPVACFA